MRWTPVPDDFDAGEDAAEVTTSPGELHRRLRRAGKKRGCTFISADVAQVPSTTTVLTDPDRSSRWASCWTPPDDDDDVQNAWHTSRTRKTWIAKPQECQKRVKGDFALFFVRQNYRACPAPA